MFYREGEELVRGAGCKRSGEVEKLVERLVVEGKDEVVKLEKCREGDCGEVR